MSQVQANARGIPQAPFVANVTTFLSGSSHEQTLAKFQEMINKYKFMENHISQRKLGLESKIPEIKKSLDLVILLDQEEKDLEIDFELNDTLWVKSTIAATKTVNLWLGVRY